MGECWNCGVGVILKDEEVRCSRCKQIVRYWCNNCKQPFDVENKETKKKVRECKWCGFFFCPNCSACSPNCQKFEHYNQVKKLLNNLIPINKWEELNKIITKIVEYFEDVKMEREKTCCGFGVPKTYAKERIKTILARMDSFKVRDETDRQAFEKRHEEILDEGFGHEFTIGNSRDAGSYGQEYRDVFNLCVCLGKLKYKRKSFMNEKDVEIGYDSWIRVEENQCPYLDTTELVVKYCPKCKREYSKNEKYCLKCIYTRGGKKHEKGEHFELIEKLSNNPTCKNLSQFKKRGEDGESEPEEDD